MENESKARFYVWPGGLKSIAGGSRLTIKLSRPWQQDIVVDSENCPFCKKPQTVLGSYFNGRWRLVQNAYTPFEFHGLVIPDTCWPKEKLRSLGDAEKITEAIEIGTKAAQERSSKPFFITVHIGTFGGQNVSHLHYHVIYEIEGDGTPEFLEEIRQTYKNYPNLVILQKNNLSVAVGGIRAGQCFIFTENDSAENGDLVALIEKLVILGNRKFTSDQGLSPDYSLALYFNRGFQYGLYTPALNHWGGYENLALYTQRHFVAPWLSETTAEYLKDS
ncbi:MAG: hypothetical protein AAB885_01705 [Patescibacteria group bacterium]